MSTQHTINHTYGMVYSDARVITVGAVKVYVNPKLMAGMGQSITPQRVLFVIDGHACHTLILGFRVFFIKVGAFYS